MSRYALLSMHPDPLLVHGMYRLGFTHLVIPVADCVESVAQLRRWCPPNTTYLLLRRYGDVFSVMLNELAYVNTSVFIVDRDFFLIMNQYPRWLPLVLHDGDVADTIVRVEQMVNTEDPIGPEEMEHRLYGYLNRSGVNASAIDGAPLASAPVPIHTLPVEESLAAGQVWEDIYRQNMQNMMIRRLSTTTTRVIPIDADTGGYYA